jgi:hypothetical protein
VRLRILTVAAGATLVAAGLAGCRTNVGSAASVGGERITESVVNSYITRAGAAPSVAAQAAKSGVSPRSQVLQYLIQEQVFEQTLAANGRVPTVGQLAATHDAAASVLLQTSLTGRALDDAIKKGLPTSGISPKFVAKYLRVQELEYALIKSKRLTQLSELLALIKKADIPVSVSARYGQWDPKSLSVTTAKSTPSYLELQPTPTSTPAS